MSRRLPHLHGIYFDAGVFRPLRPACRGCRECAARCTAAPAVIGPVTR